MKKFALLLSLLVLACDLYAEEIRYIHDKLYVPMRSGQSNEHRIVKVLVSGSRLTVLEENKESGYVMVRTGKGVEGWVQSQYLIVEPTASILLKRAEKELQTLKDELAPMKQNLGDLKQNKQSDLQKIEQLQSQNKSLSAELDEIKKVSANALALDSNNKNLLKKNELLQNQVDVLSADNDRLKHNTEQDAFINGAIAVGFGVLLTLLIPRLVPRKRKHSEWA